MVAYVSPMKQVIQIVMLNAGSLNLRNYVSRCMNLLVVLDTILSYDQCIISSGTHAILSLLAKIRSICSYHLFERILLLSVVILPVISKELKLCPQFFIFYFFIFIYWFFLSNMETCTSFNFWNVDRWDSPIKWNLQAFTD